MIIAVECQSSNSASQATYSQSVPCWTEKHAKRRLVRVPISILNLIKLGCRFSGKHGELIFRVRRNRQQFYTINQRSV